MDQAKLQHFVDGVWTNEVVPTLVDYIRIPNKSPSFDPDWAAHGHMDKAVALFEGWARRKIAGLEGATLDVVRLPSRTPVILIEVPGTAGGDTVLLYGHLDKQPEMAGWDEGTGPWTPVMKGDKLFGRGGADDGYAMFGALTAIAALHQQGIPHARCVVLIEACEESGSYDLPHYVDHLAGRIGSPSLVVCLDSGCGNYDQLWLTTSLRGMYAANLTVRVLDEGVHSGDASGVVPSSFRIFRQLISRLENEMTGEIHAEGLHVQVPAERIAQARRGARRPGLCQVPVREEYEARHGRPRRAGAEPHLAAAACDHGNRGAAVTRQCRERAAALHDGEAESPPAADPRGRQGRRDREEALRGEAALRRRGQVRAPEHGHRLERARALALARAVAHPRLGGRLRQAAGLHGRGRHHSLHGDARREIPEVAIRGDGRAGSALQRPRSQRVPAHPDGPARHRRGRQRARRSLRAATPDVRLLAPEGLAELRLGARQHAPLRRGQAFTGAVDVEGQHRHRGLVGRALAAPAPLGRALERECDLARAPQGEHAGL